MHFLCNSLIINGGKNGTKWAKTLMRVCVIYKVNSKNRPPCMYM